MNAKVDDKHTEAVLQTTSGNYPEKDGDFAKLPSKQLISEFVAKAVNKIGITNTSGWILTASGRAIDPNQTWENAGLAGQKVVLDYGPNHSGGGNA